MTLLFDQNLSPRLASRLADLYPESAHVSSLGPDRATDAEVWASAGAQCYVIVTKDADFSDASVLRGIPPKVIWIRLGNCTTGDIECALRRAHEVVTAFGADPITTPLEIV